MENGGYNLNLFGLFAVIIIIYIAYKALEKRVNIWDIQSKNKGFRTIYSMVKRIAFVGFVWWGYETLSSSYETIHQTLMLIFFSILTGAFFLLWSLLLKHKKKSALPQP